jgi:FKBP-type peptidyl-prolyl cis-trans isomerase FklB
MCPQVFSYLRLVVPRRGYRARAWLMALLAAGLTACTPADEANPDQVPETAAPAEEVVALETDHSKAGYGIGYNVAQNLAGQLGDALDSEAFQQGVADAMAGVEPRVDQEAAAAAMEALNEAQNAELAKVADAQLAAGGAFLKENGARDGVVTTASGLQYEIITVGDGPMPAATDTVITHYHGTLIDGTVFDSSVERGTPASFPVNGVIAGWVEALQLMPVGSKWRLFVPPGLAYGDRGAGGAIGPNETLIFEVELLEIKSS